MKAFTLKLFVIFAAALFMACDGDTPDSPSNEGHTHLISVEQTGTISLPLLQSFAQIAGEEEFSKLIKYPVVSYTVTYQTTFKDEPIKASGVLFIPQGLKDPAPLISLQHGTEFVKSEAPSVTNTPTGMELFAAAGYVAFMPDFIGYGESQQVFHPYYDEASSAVCVIDLIKAVREYLSEHEILFNDQLFLAGYSEGGYVTLAAAKEIDVNAVHGLKVTAVAAGAGGYDLSAMLQTITQATQYSYPSYLAFILKAYNKTYDWNKSSMYFFNEPYATAVDTYLNGQYSGSFINNKLTTDVQSLLNQEFLERLKQTEGETILKNALADNSIAGWKTDIPILLYHGTNDEIIPFSNSEITLENFKSAGATSVSLIPITGTHGSSFSPMLRDFVTWFETFRQ